MTAQDVITRGADIDVPNAFWHSFLVLTMLCLFTWAFGLIITGYLVQFTKRKTDSLAIIRIARAFGFLSIILTLCLLLYVRDSNINDYLDKVAEWKTESAYPYIESLEHIDMELTSIEKNEQALTDQPAEIIKYRNSEQIIEELGATENTPFDDTQGRQAYRLVYDVPGDDTPFVRFHMLDVDLGHGIHVGAYPLTVHLNEH